MMATMGAAGQPKTAYQTYLKDHLRRMHDEIEQTTKKLELEKRRLNKLDEDVSRTRTEYEDKCLKPRKGEIQRVESVYKLERRLEKAIAKLNHLTHSNKESRDKIDQIRRERLQMNQVFKRLHGEIKESQTEAKQVQEDHDFNRKEKEEAQHKIAAIKKRLEIERQEFKEGVKSLQEQMIDTQREEKELEVRLFKETHNKTHDFIIADEEDNFSAQTMMRRILKLAFLNTIQRRHIRQHVKNIEVFEQAFATIKSTTGISDIEEIVKIFVKLEQRNFSLLTYVNTLNREIEALEKRNKELGDQIQSQRKLDADSEKRRKNILAELKQQITSTTAVISENATQATQQNEVLDRCRPFIQQISKTVEKENRGFGGQAPVIDGDDVTHDNVLNWLTYIERTLMQWRDFLPEKQETKYKAPNRQYKYTVGNQVMGLPTKKFGQHTQLVKTVELPSAANVLVDTAQQGGGRPPVVREGDSDSDEDDVYDHPWTRNELRDKAIASVAKRRGNRKKHDQAAQDNARSGDMEEKPSAPAGGADGGKKELGYDDMVEKASQDDEGSGDSEGGSDDEEAGPDDDEINEIFLKRYKMSREELQSMAEKMGIQLNNLCYLKQEFDAYDEDRSGYIDVKELKELLEKLGEELSEEELDQAFRELDQDGSGEIEFFEFVEWFTSED